MRYLNSSELSQFHDALLDMCDKHASNKGQKPWGYPGGVTYCDTYSFHSKFGLLYIGHYDLIAEKRWWIPLALEEQISGGQLPISFEMCIPKTENRYVSVHYTVDDNKIVHVLHKGKFTVGRRSVSMDEFLNYYRKTPGKWQLINFCSYVYLELGRVNLILTDADFVGLLDSLAEFAKYIWNLKSGYRGIQPKGSSIPKYGYPQQGSSLKTNVTTQPIVQTTK